MTAFLGTLERHRRTVWLGQSIDTSVLHACYHDFATLPVLTSIGCVIRKPHSLLPKFDARLRQRLGAGGRLAVDSGGFVLMSKPDSEWRVDRVAEIYQALDADHVVALDVPPNPADDETVRQRKYRRTLANLIVLLERLGPRVIPVVHGVTAAELERNCREIGRLVPDPPIIGIGGLVPLLQACGATRTPGPATPQRRVVATIARLRAHFPRARLHVFGVGSIKTVLAVLAAGAHSVDSIGWRQAAGFGSIFLPGGDRRLLTERARTRPCRPFASPADLDRLAACRCPTCRAHDGTAHLARHFEPRAIHNIWMLYAEAAGYLDAIESGTAAAYIASRLSDVWLEALTYAPLTPLPSTFA